MTFKIAFIDIPADIRDNFLKMLSPLRYGLPPHIFRDNLDQLLKEFKCYRTTGKGTVYYNFESEAHYTWFLLRYS